MSAPQVLVIACGALARELLAITEVNGLDNVTVECLPASLHNRPSEIPELVRARIRRARGHVVPGTTWPDAAASTPEQDGHVVPGTTCPPGRQRDTVLVDDGTAVAAGTFDEILIGYADCGTGGLLQQVCIDEGVEMLAGAHCYQFFATHEGFDRLQDHAIGSFYLTDFLARNWERLIWEGLGIAKHPELRDMYFGNYTRLVYLEQTDDPKALAAAHACANRLQLELHIEHTGYGELETTMVDFTRKASA